MLVDQIAAGYWRTIRARRFETAMFDNHLRTKKLAHGKDPGPNSRDDEGCAVILQVTDPKDLQNYFRYDATISRDYYRAIATLEKMQAARRREEDRQERKGAEQTGTEPLPEPEPTVNTAVNSIGFVSYYDRAASSDHSQQFKAQSGAGPNHKEAPSSNTRGWHPQPGMGQ